MPQLASPGESVVLCSGQGKVYVLVPGACHLCSIHQPLFLRPTEVTSRKAQAPPRRLPWLPPSRSFCRLLPSQFCVWQRNVNPRPKPLSTDREIEAQQKVVRCPRSSILEGWYADSHGSSEPCLGEGTGVCVSLPCTRGNTALPHALPCKSTDLLSAPHRQQGWA